MSENIKDLVVILPMAGRGQRFKDVGVMTPKPLIEVAGRPMISRAVSSLGFFNGIPRENVVAIVRPDDVRNHQLDSEIERIFPGISILTDKNPRGATCTALVAKNYIQADSRVLIMDCDIWFKNPAYENSLLNPTRESSGTIPVFAAEGDRWSFSAVDSKSRVRRIIEKRRVDIPGCRLLANVGFYYFSRGEEFLKYAAMALSKSTAHEECYLSQVIQEMLRAGLLYHAEICDDVVDMGTPDSYQKAEYFFRQREPATKLTTKENSHDT